MYEFTELIIKEEANINGELFKNYFKFQMPSAMSKALYNLNDREKNNLLVDIIKSGLSDLKNEIKKMSEEEIEIENPNEIVDIVEKSLSLIHNKKV